jgi:hypothetical protein
MALAYHKTTPKQLKMLALVRAIKSSMYKPDLILSFSRIHNINKWAIPYKTFISTT